MITTLDETAMSGIFLVLVSMPWSLVLNWLQEFLSLDSMLFNTLFLVAGGLLNAFIVYTFTQFIVNRKKQ
jgi:hypothetical protein